MSTFNHPLFGFQNSLIVDRLVWKRVPTPDAPDALSLHIIHTDMTGRVNGRTAALAEAERDFITMAVQNVGRVSDVSFDPALLISMNHKNTDIADVLALLIRKQANQIARDTRRGAGNACVVSRWALGWLTAGIALIADEEPANYPHNNADSGLVYMGRLRRDSTTKVYLCPTLPRETPVLVSYTGDSTITEDDVTKPSPSMPLDAGAFLARLNGECVWMTPPNDTPDIFATWKSYYAIVPVIN